MNLPSLPETHTACGAVHSSVMLSPSAHHHSFGSGDFVSTPGRGGPDGLHAGNGVKEAGKQVDHLTHHRVCRVSVREPPCLERSPISKRTVRICLRPKTMSSFMNELMIVGGQMFVFRRHYQEMGQMQCEFVTKRLPIVVVESGGVVRNTECDYSSAYISIFTDGESPLVGHGMTFTIGRGNEIVSWTTCFVRGRPHAILRSVKQLQCLQASSLVVIQRIFSRVWGKLGTGCLLIRS